MEERNTSLRSASHLERLLRRQHKRYVANGAAPRDLTIVVRNTEVTFRAARRVFA